MDDVIVKSKKRKDHPVDLEKVFQILQNFNMRMNPEKCTFGVTAGKFLGCMVSSRGIEANPEKVQAIINMHPPRTIREVQILNGRITALGRFISSSARRYLPFYRSSSNEERTANKHLRT